MITGRFYFCKIISLGPYRTIFRANKPLKKLQIKESQIFKLLIRQFFSNCLLKPYSPLKSAWKVLSDDTNFNILYVHRKNSIFSNSSSEPPPSWLTYITNLYKKIVLINLGINLRGKILLNSAWLIFKWWFFKNLNLLIRGLISTF